MIVGTYTNQDGTLNICYPSGNVWARLDDPNVLEIFETDPYVADPDNPSIQPVWRPAIVEEICTHNMLIHGGSDLKLVDNEVLLAKDNYFRTAWRHEEQDVITVDMERAREIHKDVLREKRAELFLKLDIEYTKADEAKDQAAKDAIAAKRQALRDVTKDAAIDSAATPEELKQVGLDTLEENK